MSIINVCELQRPVVIISVAGGAQNFTLNPKKLNEMMAPKDARAGIVAFKRAPAQQLQRPDVIISVTGGAQNFTLNPKKLNEMMRRIFTDMMQALHP
ncbi:hypothetical protein T484DRAFT_1849741 [Baffinella frigidus]|nr:hypothetical protein T484DRAFT_1849741 [Cryptophyta sp. CCMP2293]